MAFAIKAEVRDPRATTFEFVAQKTMYGGKHIAEGDTVFVFASENEGGQGLVAYGIVTSAKAIAKKRTTERQTPRVSITVRRKAFAKRPLGRSKLKHLKDWNDGQPGTELNFKLYRQATNKIVGLSDEAEAFLEGFFLGLLVQPSRRRGEVTPDATCLVLVKHGLPVFEMSRPPREWQLSAEGELQSKRLAGRLRSFAPFRLIASPEPKARSTGNVIASELGVPVVTVAGTQEFNRPALPWRSKADRDRENERIFEDPDEKVLGTESGRDALSRFSAAIEAELDCTEQHSLVVITHGTVISLFVAAHNAIDAYGLWKDLECASFVVLDLPSLSVREVVHDAT